MRDVESRVGHRFPDELRRILATACRPEGFVGQSYIAFLDPEDLIQCWTSARDEAKGFVPFATNGAGEYYGFDSRRSPVRFLLMPSIGMEWDVAMFLGDTWIAFWETLRKGDLFERTYQEF